jgi:hypothetical protein
LASVGPTFLGAFLDRILSFFPSTRVGAEAFAQLCVTNHMWPLIAIGGTTIEPDEPTREHIDVEVTIWNKGSTPITFFHAAKARAAGQELEEYTPAFQEVTLQVGGKREQANFGLWTKPEEVLRAKAGDELRVWLQPSHGRKRKVKAVVRER